MTDEKDKDSNVKPLFKTVKKQPVETKIVIHQDVVDEIKTLLEAAEVGGIVGLVYTTSNADSTSNYNIVGTFPIPDRTQNMLRVLDDDFYEMIIRPMITGEYPEDL